MKLFFLLLLPFSVFCQTYTLTESVKDTANSPVPLANIFTSTGEGTLTNENGEFILKVNAFPVQIKITHVSFEAISLKISEEKALNIVLRESIKTLPEAKVGNYVLELIKKAIVKINADSIHNHFSKGFYRRLQKEGDKYTLLQEIFFNAGLDGKRGFNSILPIASRYTFHDGHVENKRLFSTTRLFTSPNPLIRLKDNTSKSLSINDLSKFYMFEIESFQNQNTPEEIAVIVCKPKLPYDNYFEGRFYLRTSTETMLRVKGRRYISTKGFTKNFWFKVKGAYYDFDINYLEKEDYSIFSGINLKYILNVLYASSISRTITEQINMVIYEYDQLKVDESSKLQTTVMQEDQLFATTQESTEFWENNPIIKRTPLEDEVIKAFEKKKTKGGNMVFPAQK